MLCTLEGLEIWLPRACVSCFKVPDGSCEISTNYGPLVFGFYIWIFFIKPGLVAAQRHIVLHFLSSLLCLYFRTKVWTLDVNNFAACIKITLKGLAKDNFLPAWRCEKRVKQPVFLLQEWNSYGHWNKHWFSLVHKMPLQITKGLVKKTWITHVTFAGHLLLGNPLERSRVTCTTITLARLSSASLCYFFPHLLYREKMICNYSYRGI